MRVTVTAQVDLDDVLREVDEKAIIKCMDPDAMLDAIQDYVGLEAIADHIPTIDLLKYTAMRLQKELEKRNGG